MTRVNKMTAHYRWPENSLKALEKQANVRVVDFGAPRVAGLSARADNAGSLRGNSGQGLRVQRAGAYRMGFKRGLDIALVVLSLPMTLPMIAIFALCNVLTGNSPFYSQPRLGRDGRVFRMWKLRTMVADADRKLAEVLARDDALRMEWEHTQKLRNDPRITAVGRYLRMTSMDELPQLWNVLRGDMSLVGPRPMLPEQRALYSGDAYFRLRPGLTGTWQVSERNGTCFSARARYDAMYEADVSLANDLRLILATFSAVVRGTGV